jgi:protein-disulfide isomerase
VRDRLGVVANAAIIVTAAFVLFGAEGPVGRQVSRWHAARTLAKTVQHNWDSLVSGPRLAVSVGAPLLVEFTDYECPFCRQQHAVFLGNFDEQDLGSIVVRHLPLPIHPRADGAARSAVCAEAQGRFRAMHDRLFATEAWRSDSNWIREARAARVPDLREFSRCLRSGTTVSRIRSDVALAEKLRIRGTPTFVSRTTVFSGILDKSTFLSLAGPVSRPSGPP